MVDSLGYRKTFGVIAPSTNTAVQPEYDSFRPPGVTNHFSRIHIPDRPLHDDADFSALMEDVRSELVAAVDRVLTAGPDYLVLGMSAETFWDGPAGADDLRSRLEARSGLGVGIGSEACLAALRCHGTVQRIGVVTPYQPVGDERVRRFFAESGYDIVALKGLRCPSPRHIARVTEKELRDAILAVNDREVEAIVQVGTNLAMARVAGVAEFWLDKPVIAINTATFWWALRQNGITDKVHGYGSLFVDY